MFVLPADERPLLVAQQKGSTLCKRVRAATALVPGVWVRANEGVRQSVICQAYALGTNLGAGYEVFVYHLPRNKSRSRIYVRYTPTPQPPTE